MITLLNANAIHIPLDDNCVQVVCTSPPYLGLRSYPGIESTIWPAIEYTPMVGLPSVTIPGDGECEHTWGKELPKSGGVSHGQGGSTLTGGHDSWGERDGATQGQFCQRCGAWRGVLGNEPSPTMYVAHLVLIFREIRRVLHPSGTVWLNLGSSYAGSPPRQRDVSRSIGKEFKPKDLIPIPWMVAMALQADGWWLRSDCIWHKNNPLPESVTDRPTKAHEYLFLLSKNARYFYDADAIREPPKTTPPASVDNYGGHSWHNHESDDVMGQSQYKTMPRVSHPAGRNRRTVWTASEPLFRLRHDLTPEQRAYVLQRIAGADCLWSCDTAANNTWRLGGRQQTPCRSQNRFEPGDEYQHCDSHENNT